MSFSKRLKRTREHRQLSQKALAEKIYISQQAYAKYENGTSSPNPETLKCIADALDVSPTFLLTSTEIWAPSAQEDFRRIKTPEDKLLFYNANGVPEDKEEDYLALKQGANHISLKGSSIVPADEQEELILQKYRDNPLIKNIIDSAICLDLSRSGTVSELPVAARSGKIGKATPTASNEEQDAALKDEFPSLFEEGSNK